MRFAADVILKTDVVSQIVDEAPANPKYNIKDAEPAPAENAAFASRRKGHTNFFAVHESPIGVVTHFRSPALLWSSA
jgi:hypothetical protein